MAPRSMRIYPEYVGVLRMYELVTRQSGTAFLLGRKFPPMSDHSELRVIIDAVENSLIFNRIKKFCNKESSIG